MAGIDQIFSHSTPVVFDNEAPVSSDSIADKIFDRGFDIADTIIQARYGTKAAIPAQAATQAALLAQQQAAAANSLSSGLGLALLALLVIFLLTRK